jgi:hypothetical protein
VDNKEGLLVGFIDVDKDDGSKVASSIGVEVRILIGATVGKPVGLLLDILIGFNDARDIGT